MTTVEIDIDLDSLGPKDLEVLGIPRFCPDWCTGSHRQAVEEGCDAESARVHIAGDFCGQSRVEDEHYCWGIWLRADPGSGGFTGQPVIDLETRPHSSMVKDGERGDGFTIRLNTGAARVLARQLLHFADAGDLGIPS